MVLDQTAFYAESGGQVGDRGLLTSVADAGDDGAGGPLAAVAAVHDVQRAAGGSLFVHSVAVQRGRMHVGQQVRFMVPLILRETTCSESTDLHCVRPMTRVCCIVRCAAP